MSYKITILFIKFILEEEKLVNGATAFLDGSDLYGMTQEAPLKDNQGKINLQKCIRYFS